MSSKAEILQNSGQRACFRTVEEDRLNIYAIQLNFSGDKNAGASYSSVKLIEARTSDSELPVVWILSRDRQRTQRCQVGYLTTED